MNFAPPSQLTSSPSNSPSRSHHHPPIIQTVLVIVTVVFSVVAIHTLIRFILNRRRRRQEQEYEQDQQDRERILQVRSFLAQERDRRRRLNGSSSASSDSNANLEESRLALINALPLFKLSSAIAAHSKFSPDYAICLSPFDPDDQLRLLTACHHAFHSECVDAWLLSTPTCPLCRTSITDDSGSRSFRDEIGRVSSRRTGTENDPHSPEHLRSYSLGSLESSSFRSAFSYLIEEEIEVIVEPPAVGPGDDVA